MSTREQTEQKFKQVQSSAFHNWMEQSTTKGLLSIAPPFEHMEALLKAAFESGFGAGQGSMAVELLEGLMTLPRSKRDL